MLAKAPSLILASASPRRAELLAQMGHEFAVRTADIDETALPGEAPDAYVQRLAEAKAARIARDVPDAVVLGSDTSVIVDGEILGKPVDQAHGLAMLAKLSGRSHQVLTAIAVVAGVRQTSQVVETDVFFRDIGEDEALAYWHTGEPLDKAGGYGIQGLGAVFVERIEGSYSAVVGLPIQQTDQLLRGYGIAALAP